MRGSWPRNRQRALVMRSKFIPGREPPGVSPTLFEKLQCAARRFLTSEQGASSTQSSLKLDDEELLLELPLLRLGKGGAAVEVGGDSVKSASCRCTWQVAQSTKCKCNLQQCKHSHKKTKPNPSTRCATCLKTTVLNFEDWDRGMIFHRSSTFHP